MKGGGHIAHGNLAESKPKFSIGALAIAAAILNALCFLFVSLMNLILPWYGGRYLAVLTSLYPGYDPASGPVSLIVGTLYALLAGAVSGIVLARIIRCREPTTSKPLRSRAISLYLEEACTGR